MNGITFLILLIGVASAYLAYFFGEQRGYLQGYQEGVFDVQAWSPYLENPWDTAVQDRPYDHEEDGL